MGRILRKAIEIIILLRTIIDNIFLTKNSRKAWHRITCVLIPRPNYPGTNDTCSRFNFWILILADTWWLEWWWFSRI